MDLQEFFIAVKWVHRLVGYPTAFVVAPAALLSFAGVKVHRRWGVLYVCLMCFLYATGTAMTFYHHPLASWDFARNLAFNFAGFSLVLSGWRAIWLMQQPRVEGPTRLDRALTGSMLAASLGMLAVGFKHFPSLVLGGTGLALVRLDWREHRGAIRDKRVLLARHMRYMIGSYAYVLMVLSVVHLAALPQAVRWLWAWAVGLAAVLLCTGDAHVPLRRSRATVTRYTVWGTLAAAYAAGGYILVDASLTAIAAADAP